MDRQYFINERKEKRYETTIMNMGKLKNKAASENDNTT
jgi:hypothetical protein